MQPLNDHMEDIIRRAAQDYPLDTRGADWQQVQNKLVEDDRRRRPFWLLLLLLPLGAIGYFFLPVKNDTSGNTSEKVFSKNQTATPAKTPATSAVISPGATKEPENTVNQKVLNTPAAKNGRAVIIVERSDSKSTATAFVNQSLRIAAASENDVENTTEGTTAPKANLASFDLSNRRLDFRLSPAEKISPSDWTFNFPQREKKFYLGIAGGVDATTIHWQKIERTGSRAGFVAGYRFSHNWSIETGMFSTTKYYFTSGEYFDKSKLGTPSTWIIENVDGSCRMIEIPLALRYNFGKNAKGNWFGSAGVRSYVMQQENYDYAARYGSGTVGSHYYTYDNGGTRLAADLSFSGGYQWPLGKAANVRLEPFIQLPLRGMGVGNLKFTSVGVQAVLTRNMF